MYLVSDRSCTLTLPAPAPPPTWAEPEFDMPQLQARTSISPACALSTDSPLRAPILMNMSIAIFLLLELDGAPRCASVRRPGRDCRQRDPRRRVLVLAWES